jgi:hypothetical protein
MRSFNRQFFTARNCETIYAYPQSNQSGSYSPEWGYICITPYKALPQCGVSAIRFFPQPRSGLNIHLSPNPSPQREGSVRPLPGSGFMRSSANRKLCYACIRLFKSRLCEAPISAIFNSWAFMRIVI